MINLNDFAKEVHENAVAHGFWEGERSDAEIIALIHSEWSEALEEYRAGKPMAWHGCDLMDEEPCETCPDCADDDRPGCKNRMEKPEGVAVELIDGCIRILDCLAERGEEIQARFDRWMTVPLIDEAVNLNVPSLCVQLHDTTSECHDGRGNIAHAGELINAVAFIFKWLRARGIDPEAIMMEKHRYNKGRPYKHGKVC